MESISRKRYILERSDGKILCGAKGNRMFRLPGEVQNAQIVSYRSKARAEYEAQSWEDDAELWEESLQVVEVVESYIPTEEETETAE